MNFAQLRNFLLFQLGWWATAFGVFYGRVNEVLVVQLLVLGLHLIFEFSSRELKFILGVSLFGYLSDGLFQNLSLFQIFPEWKGGWPHPWLWGLWALFASTLNHSLAWIFRSRSLAVVLGGVGGPLTYLLAGQQFHILSFEDPLLMSLSLYVLMWGAMMLLFYEFRKMFVRIGHLTEMEMK